MKKMSPSEAPWADGTKLFIIDTGEWRYQRPITKRDKCCRCGNCYLFCPVGCIECSSNYFAANLEYCKGCGVCASVCPVDAIRMVREDGSSTET
jgi:pyruvate ferredoxin oxidoreductase delta subunit